MTDYVNGKNVLLRPEPGRPVHPVIQETKTVQNVNVDTNAIADAVIKAIANKMPHGNFTVEKTVDSFDNSESLKRLADAMSVQGKGESNLEGLGNVKEVKRDKKETDKAIDLLSKLGD
jgi:hypothetical protein